MASIVVVGTGYVGITTAAYLAHLGHSVVGSDVDAAKIDLLNRGEVPILEDGLTELVREGIDGGRLVFVLGNAAAVERAEPEFVFLCVPTPQADDGSADLSYIESAARDIGPVLLSESVVINKSTVPVGSTLVVERALARGDIAVVSNPEFLREGSAVHDCLNPDRIVIGSEDQAAAIRVASLFSDIKSPVIVTDPASAETIKYASNAFLATKLSFVNAIANLCEAVGADVRDVIVGMGYDKRIGFEFLKPGPGWGGSCFVGEESVVVERAGAVRLLTFERLFEQVAVEGSDGWRALTWSPDEPAPHFAPISTFTRRDYEGDLIKLRTKMGRRLTVTADHPFVVGDGMTPEPTGIRLAGELTTTDWLPLAIGTPWTDTAAPYYGNPLDGLELDGIARSFSTVTNGTYVPDYIPMDASFWRMIGLYLAEGHIGVDGGRHRICWSFNHAETDLAEFVAGYWRSIGVMVTIRKLATALQVSISSRVLSAWFRHVLGVGTNSNNHALPDMTWSLFEREQRALLRGLWDGDGSWSFIRRGASVVLEYGTTSRALADGMVRLLGQLGVVARLKVGRTPKSTRDTYWIVVSGADNVEAGLFLLPDGEADAVRESHKRLNRRIAPTGHRPMLKSATWVRVDRVERSEYSGPVYSLEVRSTGTVVTSFGLVAHNCFPKDSRALVRIAEESGYDFSLLKGVIEVNEEQFERISAKIVRLAGGSVDGATVAVWGLTFKARTDDTRRSPALEIIDRLRKLGAKVKAYDPGVRHAALEIQGIEVCDDAYAACEGADVLAVLTEWDEFRWVDFEKVAGVMKTPRIVDGRNLLDSAAVRRRGFVYEGLGRP